MKATIINEEEGKMYLDTRLQQQQTLKKKKNETHESKLKLVDSTMYECETMNFIHSIRIFYDFTLQAN